MNFHGTRRWLRRRRLISQPRVAELARLPWVLQRVALNPERVSRRGRLAPMDVLPLIRCANRKSTKRTRVKSDSQPCKGFNRICAASIHTARAIQSFQPQQVRGPLRERGGTLAGSCRPSVDLIGWRCFRCRGRTNPTILWSRRALNSRAARLSAWDRRLRQGVWQPHDACALARDSAWQCVLLRCALRAATPKASTTDL